MDGGLRVLAGITGVNPEFFGLGGDRHPGDIPLGYGIEARGGVMCGNYRIGNTPLWFGLRYTNVNTHVSFDAARSAPVVPVSAICWPG